MRSKIKSLGALVAAVALIAVGVFGISHVSDRFVSPLSLFVTQEAHAVTVQVSTWTQMRGAIDAAGNVPTIIELTDNIRSPGSVHSSLIPAGADITITSAPGSVFTFTQATVHRYHFDVAGNLTLRNIVLSGDRLNVDHPHGGIAVRGDGVLVMEEGSILTLSLRTAQPGGLYIYGQATVYLRDNAAIVGNYAHHGGGIGIMGNATLHIGDDVLIADNASVRIPTAGSGRGGGISISGSATVFIGGNASIINNSAEFTGTTTNVNYGNGGGISVQDSATLHITDNVTIAGNTAMRNGGGIYVGSASSVSIEDSVIIIDNVAANGGGGIWTYDYHALSISPLVVFNGNIANSAHDYGLAQGLSDFPDIRWARNSIIGTHLLNNYDINFTGNPIQYYEVDFMVQDDLYQMDRVLAGALAQLPAPPEREGYLFAGWGNITGQMWDFGVPIMSNLVLYAQWMAPPLPPDTGFARVGSPSNMTSIVALVVVVLVASGVVLGIKFRRSSRY